MIKPIYHPTTRFQLWLVIAIWSLGATEICAQSRSSLDQEVFTVVECPPEFPGGFPAIRDYLMKYVQYPPAARTANRKGRVFVSFVVNRNGLLSTITVEEGLGYGCDEEAIRLISEMPQWIPGSQSGQTIRVKLTLPVLFGIDYPKDYPRQSRR